MKAGRCRLPLISAPPDEFGAAPFRRPSFDAPEAGGGGGEFRFFSFLTAFVAQGQEIKYPGFREGAC